MEGTPQALPTAPNPHRPPVILCKNKRPLGAVAAGGKRTERKEEHGPQLQGYCLSTTIREQGLTEQTSQ